MLTGNTQFEVELKKLLDAEIRRLTSVIASGTLPDYSKYQWYCGLIKGLESVINNFDEVHRIINNR